MKAAIYHRVSGVDQDPELARAELRRAAAARGLEVVLGVEETGSGARNDRPGLQRVMDAARRGTVDAVLVWKLDRFGRSALDLLSNLRALEHAGVSFSSVTQAIEVRADGDAMSRLMLTVLAGVAEFERSLIIERTRLGLAAARRRGVQLGRRVDDGAPDGADVARLRTAGYSWPSVAGELGTSVGACRRSLRRHQRAAAPTPLSTVKSERRGSRCGKAVRPPAGSSTPGGDPSSAP